MNTTSKTRARSEDGYILVAVMFMLALLIIAMGVAAPRIARSIQRDREVETMHRGKQYARAVKMYYKKFNAYPPNVDALVKTNDLRFLRRKYIDPMTGKVDWKPIPLGMNKAPTMLGFFGVPIGGAGAGGGLCGNALPSSTPGSTSTTSSSSGSFGASSGGFGSSSSSFGSSGSSIGSGPTAGCPSTTDSSASSTGSATASGTDANGNPISPNGANGNTTAANGGTDSSGSGTTSGTAGGPAGSSNPTQNGQTMGGAGIMGFEPVSPKQSILVYKKKNHYNQWEFVYDPVAEQMLMQGGANQGSNGLTNGTNPTGTGGIGSGGGIGGSPTGNGTGFGGGGSTIGGGAFGGGSGSTAPAQPQQ